MLNIFKVYVAGDCETQTSLANTKSEVDNLTSPLSDASRKARQRAAFDLTIRCPICVKYSPCVWQVETT